MQRYVLIFLLFKLCPGYLYSQGQIEKQSNWQQKVNHKIDVELYYDPVRAHLKASQEITYFNNSPDTLNEIFLHLWSNAYKNNLTPFAKQQAAMTKKEFLVHNAKKGYIEIENVKVNNRVTELRDGESEIASIILAQPLLSGDSLIITMDFDVLIPPFYSRMGATENFVAATQWYPKLAVYDVNGWNTMPYLDQGEFYSEFGDYEVTITTPADFLVASTGNLQTESEKKYLNELSIYYLNDDKEKVNKMPKSPWGDKRVVTYTQNNIHDFAWFASSEFKVISQNINLNSGKKVFTNFFTTQTPKQKDLDNIMTSLLHYSDHVGDYAYDVCNVVIGPLIAGGGMEYPTITICASNDFEVVMHEIGHNWFYGVLGSNERSHPWMDESINSFYENMFQTDDFKSYAKVGIEISVGDKKYMSNYFMSTPDKLLELSFRRLGESQSGILPANEYNSLSYYSVIYGKIPHAFAYLREYLGKETFYKAMSDYYEKWKFKHPLPQDIQESFEVSTGQNLDWFFHDFLNDYKGTDFEIVYVKQLNTNDYEVKFRNNSELNVPLHYGFLQKDAKEFSETGFIPAFAKDTTVILKSIYGRVENIRIDPYHILPENKRVNDLVNIKGINKKSTSGLKIRVKGFSFVENLYQREVFIHPAIGYNLYSGVGVGLNVFNRVFPFKKFEYNISPLYAFKSKNIVGMADVMYNFRVFNNSIYRIKTEIKTQRFDYLPNGYANTYNKVSPSVTFYFRTKGIASERFKKQLEIQAVNVFSDRDNYEIYNKGLDTTYIREFNPSSKSDYLKLTYSFRDNHAINPSYFSTTLEGGNTGLNSSTSNAQYVKFDFNYKIAQIFNKKGDAIRAEFRAGSMLYKSGNLEGIYLYRGSGNTGEFDYLFNDLLIGRNERLGSSDWGQQLITQGGDMRINAFSFIDNSYISMKFEGSIPYSRGFRVYADLSINPSDLKNASLYWVGGLSYVLFDNILEFYIPLLYSNNFADYYTQNNVRFFQRAVFKLNLDYVYFRKNLEKFRPFIQL